MDQKRKGEKLKEISVQNWSKIYCVNIIETFGK